MREHSAFNSKTRKPLRVAVVWGCGLGDFLAIYPLLNFLATKKHAEITYLTKESHMPSMFKELSNSIPGLSVEFIPKNFQILALIYKYWRYFDALFVMEDHFRIGSRLFSRCLFPRRLCTEVPDKKFIATQVRENVRRCFGWEWSNEPIELPFRLSTSDRNIEWDQRIPGYLILHPSCRSDWQTTRWPAAKWVELMQGLLSESGYDLCLVGLESDEAAYRQMANQLVPQHRPRVHMILDWPLGEVAELIKQSRGSVCHNSGIMHMAALLSVPTVVLNGSSARHWQRGEPWVENISPGSCRLACNRRRCPVPGFNSKCIKDIGVEMVMQHCRKAFL